MKDDLVYLGHIDEFCEDLKTYLYEIKDFEELKKSKLYQDAIVRKLEIIGEASKNISDELKLKYPEVEWRKIKAMRDRLIHTNFGIDLSLVWEVIIKDIPILHEQIKKIIKDLND
jgi:uncharacterized protein with HEPN domain